MSLNIKNQRVHDLAREAAARTGRTQTGAIELALERLLGSLDEAEAAGDARLAAILADLDARLDPGARARLRTDDLYDESGLPA